MLIKRQTHYRQLAVLTDPAEESPQTAAEKAAEAAEAGADFIFVGGSLTGNETEAVVLQIKSVCQLPVVLFPGNLLQITDKADALLLLSLISGRNPDMLIGRHVTAAPLLRRMNLEIISSGYMLIESGKQTSVEYISNTRPIPADKSEIAAATASAGEMLGLQSIYLEAGSGAQHPVNPILIQEVRKTIQIPLITGGGIKTPGQAREAFQAGADLVVVGNTFEEKNADIKNFIRKLRQV